MVVTPVTTDHQLNAENFILTICLDNRLSPADLDRVAARLAHIEAAADARTSKGMAHDHDI